jgi:hypothetical protein
LRILAAASASGIRSTLVAFSSLSVIGRRLDQRPG